MNNVEQWALIIVGAAIALLLLSYFFARAVKIGKPAKKLSRQLPPSNKDQVQASSQGKITSKMLNKIKQDISKEWSKVPYVSKIPLPILIAIVLLIIGAYIFNFLDATAYSFDKQNISIPGWTVQEGCGSGKVIVQNDQETQWSEVILYPCKGQVLDDKTKLITGSLVSSFNTGTDPEEIFNAETIYYLGKVQMDSEKISHNLLFGNQKPKTEKSTVFKVHRGGSSESYAVYLGNKKLAYVPKNSELEEKGKGAIIVETAVPLEKIVIRKGLWLRIKPMLG